MTRGGVIDEEDEFDAMMEEDMGLKSPGASKQIGSREGADDQEDSKKGDKGGEEIPGGKTLDEIAEEVPQDIKK